VKLLINLILILCCVSAQAANVRGYIRDAFTGEIDTNALVITRISTNILADGGVTGQGRPQRVPFSPYTNTLGIGFYSISNVNLRTAIVINVDDDSTTLYDCTNLLHSGFNTYVTVAPTFRAITNALGYLPATNGASGGVSTQAVVQVMQNNAVVTNNTGSETTLNHNLRFSNVDQPGLILNKRTTAEINSMSEVPSQGAVVYDTTLGRPKVAVFNDDWRPLVLLEDLNNATNKLDTDLRALSANQTNGLSQRIFDTTNNPALTRDAELAPFMATNDASMGNIALSEFAGIVATNTTATDVLFIGDSISDPGTSVAARAITEKLHRMYGVGGAIGSSLYGGNWNNPAGFPSSTVGDLKGGPDFFSLYIMTNSGTINWTNYAPGANYGEMPDMGARGLTVASATFFWVAHPTGGEFKFQVSQEAGAYTDKITVSGFAASRTLRWTNLVQTTHWTAGNRVRFQAVNVSGTNEVALHNRIDAGVSYSSIICGSLGLPGLTLTNFTRVPNENWDIFLTNAAPKLGLVVVAVRDFVNAEHAAAVTNLITTIRRFHRPSIVFVGPYPWVTTSTADETYGEISQLRTNAEAMGAHFVDLSRRFNSPSNNFLNGWIVDAVTNGHPTSLGERVFGHAVIQSLHLDDFEDLVYAKSTPKLYASYMARRPVASWYHYGSGNAYGEMASAGGYGMALWFNGTAAGTFAGDTSLNLWSFAGNGTDTRMNAPNAAGNVLFTVLAANVGGVNTSGFWGTGANVTNLVIPVASMWAPVNANTSFAAAGSVMTNYSGGSLNTSPQYFGVNTNTGVITNLTLATVLVSFSAGRVNGGAGGDHYVVFLTNGASTLRTNYGYLTPTGRGLTAEEEFENLPAGTEISALMHGNANNGLHSYRLRTMKVK